MNIKFFLLLSFLVAACDHLTNVKRIVRLKSVPANKCAEDALKRTFEIEEIKTIAYQGNTDPYFKDAYEKYGIREAYVFKVKAAGYPHSQNTQFAIEHCSNNINYIGGVYGAINGLTTEAAREHLDKGISAILSECSARGLITQIKDSKHFCDITPK